jgi:methylphosphotriester-DNA--protein-cysteine methyltransferase
VRSRCFAFGLTSHELAVTVVWGSMDGEEAMALAEVWRSTFDGPPRDTIIDITHLAIADASAVEVMRGLLEHSREARARVVRRQAIVARDDYGGMFVRGYLATYPPPYEARWFQTYDDALAWLGHPCCREEIDDLDAAREDALARLRQWLDTTALGTATLEGAADELGITLRTLQRRLASAKTRFVAELGRARVSRAQRLMRDPERKIADIAIEVGCASASTFSELFTRITGEAPSEWRRRNS